MKKSIQEHITLLSPTDIIIAPIQINYDNDEDAANPVEINLTYNGVIYQGKGTDHLWVDAFADLQNRLPHGIKLACCMTCILTKAAVLDTVVHSAQNSRSIGNAFFLAYL